MAKRHGNKVHYQVLLDPHRAELLEQMAEQQGARPSWLLRDVAYNALRLAYGTATYGLAEAEDAAVRKQSIRNQVSGRTRG